MVFRPDVLELHGDTDRFGIAAGRSHGLTSKVLVKRKAHAFATPHGRFPRSLVSNASHQAQSSLTWASYPTIRTPAAFYPKHTSQGNDFTRHELLSVHDRHGSFSELRHSCRAAWSSSIHAHPGLHGILDPGKSIIPLLEQLHLISPSTPYHRDMVIFFVQLHKVDCSQSRLFFRSLSASHPRPCFYPP